MIEVALPLAAINKASVREKSIRHGHPSTLHLWWARRPLAACRAVLFAQSVDDPDYIHIAIFKDRGPDDSPSIGIIRCAEKDDLEVEFALKCKTNPIGVTEYQLKPTLPSELKGKLPSPQDLSRALGLPAKRRKQVGGQ